MAICQHCDKPITAITSGDKVITWQDTNKRHSRILCDGRDNDIRTAPQDFKHQPADEITTTELAKSIATHPHFTGPGAGALFDRFAQVYGRDVAGLAWVQACTAVDQGAV